MKKISNTIRIGMVRREDVSPKSSKDQSPSNNQEQTNHYSLKEQQLDTQGNHGISMKDHLRNQPRIHTVASANNIRLHDLTETNINKQQHTHDFHSRLTTPSVHPQTQVVNDLYEIPTKTTWWTTKKIVAISAAAVVGAVIIVTTVLAVVLTTTGDTATTTTSTTTVAPTVVSAYWSFDSVLTDLYGVYNGSIGSGGTFSPIGSTTIPYVGSGQALSLNSTMNPWFTVSTPYLYLNSTSFTIETWIYSMSLVGDRGIFGQCQCSTCINQCLFLISRNNHLYVGFSLNDLSGTLNLAANTWYHVVFIYNYQTQQQILYLNGVQDAIKSNAGAYQGKNASIQIGCTQVYTSINYFNGYIDNLLVTTRAKSADEILRDASIVVYYPFDLPNPNADSGPNKLNGVVSSTVTSSGRVNQAIRLNGAGSYCFVYGLYQVPYGVTSNRPFSISMWIYPTSITSATFIQTFATSFGGSCTNLLGIYSPGGSIGQLFVMSSNNNPALITGPYTTVNAWSHVSVTYSPFNGYTLYYNGMYSGATGNISYPTSNTFAYLFIGYFISCSSASVNLPYQGSIDEFYIHNRELTQSDVTALANP